MVIVVTGAIGIGKTTVCQRFVGLVQNLGYTCGGILSHKDADGNIVIEDIESTRKEILASTHHLWHGPRTVKYFFNPKGINFGIEAIRAGISKDILVVDEIGRLELRGEGFIKVLELIEAGKVKRCILVIRSELLPAFLARLPAAPLVFETTSTNRNHLPEEIVSIVLGKNQGEGV